MLRLSTFLTAATRASSTDWIKVSACRPLAAWNLMCSAAARQTALRCGLPRFARFGQAHLLLRLLALGNLNLLLALAKELSLLGSLDALGPGEETVVDRLGDRDGANVDLGRGGDNVGLVDSSEGDTVEPENGVSVLSSVLFALLEVTGWRVLVERSRTPDGALDLVPGGLT